MPLYHRVYSPGEFQFITASTYRRTPLFLSDHFRRCFVHRLEEVRQELHFLLAGWVLMPEHFHIMIRPELDLATPSVSGRLRNAIVEGYRAAVDSLVGTILFFFNVGPFLLLWGAILFFPARFAWRRLRARIEPDPPKVG